MTGRLVLADIAENQIFSKVLSMDDLRAMHVPPSIPRNLAPFTGSAGTKCSAGDLRDVQWLDYPGSTSCAGDRQYPSTCLQDGSLSRCNIVFCCTAGKLHPITVSADASRKTKPVIRCVPWVFLCILLLFALP